MRLLPRGASLYRGSAASTTSKSDRQREALAGARCAGKRFECAALFCSVHARLRRAELGQLDLDTQPDLGQHQVQLLVAGRVVEIRDRALEPGERSRIEVAGQEAELQFVERVERRA